MRKLFAVLVSLALVVSQMAFLSSAGSSGGKVGTAKCCGHCGGCKGGKCCMVKGDGDGRRAAPVVPAQGFSQNDLQVLSFVTVKVLPQGARESLRADSGLSISRVEGAPLYQRTHSYLI